MTLRARIAALGARPGFAEAAILVAILAALAVPKVLVAVHQQIVGGDGGFYLNVAMHVQRGHGLVTNLSLMHQGYEYFPHPTAIYPLWPLVHGYAARVLGLHPAGIWLPTLFYFSALLFAYLWAAALLPQRLFPRALPGFNAGHVLVLLFGLNQQFFWFTSLPYTEGLAYTVLFVGLWRARTRLATPSWDGGLELGLWFGLAFLARTQMLLALLALLCSVLFAIALASGERRRYATLLATTLAAYAAVVAPYLAHVRSFAPGTGFFTLLRFDQIRGTETLTPVNALVDTASLWDYIVDRAAGFPQAFSLDGEYAYALQYYTFQFALPCALPFAAVWFVRKARAGELRALLSSLREPAHIHLVLAGALALGGFVSIHLLHKAQWSEWNFHLRHALTSAFLFFLSLTLLLRSRLLPLALGLLLLSAGVFDGYAAAIDMVDRAERAERARPFRPYLVRWINERRAAEGELTLVSRYVQRISHLTPDVNYHSYFDDTSLADMRKMFTRLHADYLVLPRDVKPLFRVEPGFGDSFVQIETRSGCDIFAWRDNWPDQAGGSPSR